MNSPFDNELQGWVWAAGLFEGEGHIGYGQYSRQHRAHPAYRRTLVLGMCDQDCVERFHQVVGAGRVHFRPAPKDKPNWSDQWRWECTRWADVEATLTRLLPYLGKRRTAKANEMLANPARWDNTPGKTHCIRGHELSGDNLYEYKNRRICRECGRIRDRERYHRQKAAKSP